MLLKIKSDYGSLDFCIEMRIYFSIQNMSLYSVFWKTKNQSISSSYIMNNTKHF